MKMPGPSKYRSALASAVVIQVMFLLAAATTLDTGMAIRIVLIAAALFWAATYVIVRRYRQAPGKPWVIRLESFRRVGLPPRFLLRRSLQTDAVFPRSRVFWRAAWAGSNPALPGLANPASGNRGG